MKRKRLLALTLAAFTMFSSITAYADPGAAATEAATNGQYPLSYLANWFVVDVFGDLNWKWDRLEYVEMTLGIPEEQAGGYILENAVKDKNINYLTLPSDFDMWVIAKLAGVPLTGAEHMENDPDVLAVEKEVRDFLNSFDWRNASELEKASRVAKRIIKADYDEDASTSVDCLTKGKASCSGYTNTANLLSFCINLRMGYNGRISINHAYPVFLVNGVWLSYEPTRKDKDFAIADYKENIETMQSGNVYPGTFAIYCMATGYEAPEDIIGMFPNVATTYYEDTVTGREWKSQWVPLL